MVQGTCLGPSCFHSIWPGMPSPPIPGVPIGSSKCSLSSSKAKFKPQLLSLMQVVSLPLDGPSASCSPVCQVLRGSMANVHGIEGKLQTCSLSNFLFCDSQGAGGLRSKGPFRDMEVADVSRAPSPKSRGDKSTAGDTSGASRWTGTSEGLCGLVNQRWYASFLPLAPLFFTLSQALSVFLILFLNFLWGPSA